MGDDQQNMRDLGRLEAKVDILLQRVDTFVTRTEYEPRIKALEDNRHKKWEVVTALGSLGAFVVAAIALLRTIH